jgi:hypothetical protein
LFPARRTCTLGPGLAAGTPALAFALLDWLMAPTAALAKRVRIVTSSYPRHTGYVIALHMRIGAEAAAAADANFEDPGRDHPVSAARLQRVLTLQRGRWRLCTGHARACCGMLRRTMREQNT